jgi:predicted O-methyltransferase YrrM
MPISGAALTESDSGQRPTLADVPGWFRPIDRSLFRLVLAWQVANEPPGDLVELGCYLGKSAIVIGESVQPDETFTVCDLFGDRATDAANAAENDASYATLNREQFERNYLQFHPHLPVVLQLPTSHILDHVAADAARFVHVDASHLYEHVVTDIASAATMLREDGIVVFDDYQTPHTPGVAAAVWGATALGGPVPIALTAKKWYGTWGDPTTMRDVIETWARANSDCTVRTQTIAGHNVLRLNQPRHS